MNRSAFIATVLFLLTLSVSCKDDSNTAGIDVAIEDEFKVLLWESLDGDFRSFQINLETIESSFCENTLITTESSAENGKILLSIDEIAENSCNTTTFPAFSNFEIGTLDKKTHDLQINLKEAVFNYGTLDVNDEFYEIEMDNVHGITFPNTRLYRIPENTIWGYAVYSNTNLKTTATNFVDELSGLGEEQIYENGYYGYFSSDENNLTIHNEEISQTFQNTFGFNFQGSNTEFLEILENYRLTYPEMDFKIFTSKGEVF